MDFGGIPSMVPAMDKQELRRLFTELGCIIEDASVTSLVWSRDDTRSISDHAAVLRGAYSRISALPDKIKANVH